MFSFVNSLAVDHNSVISSETVNLYSLVEIKNRVLLKYYKKNCVFIAPSVV